VPGGAAGATARGDAEGAGPAPTRPEDVRTVVELHRSELERAGIGRVWDRVLAVVVQPGVEFDATRVYPYRRERAAALLRALDGLPGLLFEGHSTDFQDDEALRALVEDGVAVLKVGPALTFALREALFGLCFVGRELHGRRAGDLVDTVLGVMRSSPEHWKGYYAEDPALGVLLAYGYSDRIRYYWDRAEVAAAVGRLFDSLRGRDLPPGLVRQYLPRAGGLRDSAGLRQDPESLAIAAVDEELGRYERACDPSRAQPGGR